MANTLRFKRGLVSTIPTALAGEPLFTTDTFDLYIGNGTTNTRFQKYIASGTTSQLLRGDGSLLTMPIVLTSPSNGQVLKYNGTSWVNDSDSGITGSGTSGQVAYFTGATTQSGSNNLFWDATNNRLGIGTNAPLNKFELRTSNNVTFNIGNTGSEIDVKVGTNGGTYGIAANYYAGNFNFLTDAGSGTFTQKARITSTGNFIINNPSVDNGLRFQVTGDGYFSGAVSIGTTSTAQKLNVSGSGNYLAGFINSAGTLAALINFTNTSGDFFIGNDSVGGGALSGTPYARAIWGQGAYPMVFGTNNTERMRLDASGNLGLGVVPSAWGSTSRALQFGVSGAVYGNTSRLVALSNNMYAVPGTNDFYIASDFATRYYQFQGQHIWNTAPSGTAGNAITFTQAMTLDASGRLGIGLTNPTQTLHVAGTSLVTGKTYIGATSVFLDFSGGNLDFATSSVPKMTLDASGRLSIGSGSVTSELLQVNGTMRVSGASTLSSSVTAASFIPSSNTIPTNGLYLSGTNTIAFSTNTTQRLNIDATGIATFTNSVTATGSILVSNTINAYAYQNFGANSSYGWQIGKADNSGLLAPSNGFYIYDLVNNTTRFSIASTGAATFSSTAQAAGFISSGGTGYAVINSAANTVTALRPTGGGTNIMSTNSNGLHIAVGTQATGDLILATNNTERIRLSSDGFFSQGNGTNPTSSIADRYIQYSADIVAGNAAPHFRTENGAVIKIYQETTAVGSATMTHPVGTALRDTSTFDGYTLAQVVTALRNLGILQ